MKTSSIATTFLAMASAALAAPSSIKRDLQPFELSGLTASLYDQALPEYRIINFSLKDLNNNAEANCSAAPSSGMSGEHKFECHNPKYQVNFPSLFHIEDMKINVSITDSKAFGLGEINGDKWKCEDTGAEYPSKICKWDGVYELPVTLA